jgi:hypothetical protein
MRFGLRCAIDLSYDVMSANQSIRPDLPIAADRCLHIANEFVEQVFTLN